MSISPAPSRGYWISVPNKGKVISEDTVVTRQSREEVQHNSGTCATTNKVNQFLLG